MDQEQQTEAVFEKKMKKKCGQVCQIYLSNFPNKEEINPFLPDKRVESLVNYCKDCKEFNSLSNGTKNVFLANF